MKYLVLFVFTLVPILASAQVYKCVGPDGRLNFTDQKCPDGNGSEIAVKVTNIATRLKLDKPIGKVIYEGSRIGIESRFIRVSIYEETDEYMIFEVVGYNGDTHGGKMDFRVNPNIPWGAQPFTTSERGLVKGFTRVSLNSRGVDGQMSDVINLNLWYYSPQNKAKFLGSITVPYKKTWKKASS